MTEQAEPKTVRDIVAGWLKSQGYDGLCDPGICGCHLDDLMPCGGDFSVPHCVPGYSGPDLEEDADFAVYPRLEDAMAARKTAAERKVDECGPTAAE